MKAKPILFSGPMVRALLDGRKTQTRRILKPQPSTGIRRSPFVASGLEDCHGREIKIPYMPGDLLWVREAIYLTDDGHEEYAVFAADRKSVEEHLARIDALPAYFPEELRAEHKRLRPSIHMPRWASRLTLEVTNVKVERLQEISEEDARAEGIEVDQSGRFSTIAWRNYAYDNHPFNSAVASFRSLWNSLNAKRGYGWDANPWVVALTFSVHSHNVDELSAVKTAEKTVKKQAA